MRVLLWCHIDQPWVHFFVALLLLAQDELLLSVQKSLSGLALTGHHQLWSEMACGLIGGAAFCPNHGLAIDNALAKGLFVCLYSAHRWCLR